MKIRSDISDYNHEKDDDTSEYLIGEDSGKSIDFSNLSSNQFTNISPIYTSESNPTVIYSAIRYGKRFILKGLNLGFRNDPIQNMALIKEFEIGISLDHPNIRRTIGLEKVEGLGSSIILEYMDGKTLDKYIKSHPMDSYTARSIVNQIASALQYIHSKQILHRDLKLSNILISHHGLFAKIIDFNLSDSESYIVLKNPAGSERYIAPELKDGSSHPSIASDVYSFGVIVNDLANLTNDHTLKRIADICCNPEPSKRPQSVGEINLPKPEFRSGNILTRILNSKYTTWCLSIIIALTLISIIYFVYTKKLFYHG